MTHRNLRRRVAVLVDAIDDDYQAGLVRGIVRAGAHADALLVCLAGGLLDEAREDARSRKNFLYDLVDWQRFDGVVTFAGALGTRVGVEGFAEWSERFGDTPHVNLGVETPGHHSIGVDGASGMLELMTHLITAHGHERIAFIRGPSTSREAEERYEAYRSALEEHGIAFDPDLVLEGDWLPDSGAAAVAELIDVRGKRKEAVAAIACANDYMALGALDALRERGIGVPSEIALTGFDDIESIRGVVPPLTTVRQPLEAMGREGLRRLGALINGEREPVFTSLGAQMVQRRSCGCTNLDAALSSRRDRGGGLRFESALMERRSILCAELSRSAHGSLVGAGTGWEERLVAALVRDLLQKESSSFVIALERLLVSLSRAGGDLSACQAVVGVLRKAVQECAASDVEVLARASDIFDAARELLGESRVRTEILRKSALSQQLQQSFRLATTLLESTDPEAKRRALEACFRALGVPSMAIGLFTEAGTVTEECLCIAGYSGSTRLDAERTFRASEFGPRKLFEDARGTMLVQPLVFEAKPIGLLTMTLGSFDVTLYEQLREIAATGLHGYRLAEAARASR